MFLCFYSAIFQLTSAKFQTFAYTSRTVRFSYMKRAKTPPRKFSVKSGLIQKRLKYGKKYFTRILKHPFIPTSPLLGAIKFFFFFSFFFPNLVHLSSPKPQHIKIEFLCKVVVLQTQFGLPKFFWVTLPGTPSKWGPKNQFFERIKLGRQFFLYQ